MVCGCSRKKEQSVRRPMDRDTPCLKNGEEFLVTVVESVRKSRGQDVGPTDSKHPEKQPQGVWNSLDFPRHITSLVVCLILFPQATCLQVYINSIQPDYKLLEGGQMYFIPLQGSVSPV